MNGARAAFQVALDSAALMMSKDAPTKTDPERQTEAAKTFSALFNRPEVTDATVTPVFHRGRRVETTLVLDDTGSMANDGEMDAFKTASHNLQSGRSALPMPDPITPRYSSLYAAQDPLYQYTDVIILLTDGLNTQNRWSSTQTDTR